MVLKCGSVILLQTTNVNLVMALEEKSEVRRIHPQEID